MSQAFQYTALLVAAVALSAIRFLAPGLFRATATWFGWLAARRWLATALVALAAFVASASMTVLLGIPQPRIHDEFSYLLAADTFAHGRLTNPSHPLWESFEAIHLNQQPTYHSMYPPGQGGALALGQVLTGYPIVGVWLSTAAACGAICWMMRAWLPPRWALFGATVAAVRLTSAPYPLTSGTRWPGYWSHSYWGGAVAALGGALLFGAVGGLIRAAAVRGGHDAEGGRSVWRPANGIVLGLGCAILANSRPFEGLVAAIYGVAVLAVAWFLSGRMRTPPAEMQPAGLLNGPALPPLMKGRNVPVAANRGFHVASARRVLARRTAIAALGILAPAAAFMLYYNLRTTGDPLRMPYQLNMATYSTTPVCLLGDLRPAPEYRHDSIRQFYLGWVRGHFLQQQSLAGLLQVGREKLHVIWAFYCGPLLSVPLVASLFALRSRTTVFALLGCLAVVWALAHVTWLEPHYLAPVAGLFYLLVVQGIRCIVTARPFRRWLGPVFAGAFLLALVASMGVMLWDSARIDRSSHWSLKRAAIAERLARLGGRHLVLVSDKDTSLAQDWVYNVADIDAAPVVWARDSEPAQTRRLIEHFSGRRVWRLQSLRAQVELVPVAELSDPDEDRP
jgi:hypothetical protein